MFISPMRLPEIRLDIYPTIGVGVVKVLIQKGLHCLSDLSVVDQPADTRLYFALNRNGKAVTMAVQTSAFMPWWCLR